MNKNFDLFRLNCMMDDNRSKNFNSIIVSLVCDLLYQNGNKEIARNECLNFITSGLNINIEPDLFYSNLEKSSNFVHIPSASDVLITLSPEKYAEINRKVSDHSIETYIEIFVKENGYGENIAISIKSLLYQSIYENINSFTVTNIKSIIPDNLKSKHNRDEINAFNTFLDENNKAKNVALFYVFLKAVEFAIVTSGKGIKSFSKEIFVGKEYCLDSNIIFRLLGVGGKERKESLTRLIKSCVHQGIKFGYTVDTYQEVVRKLQASQSILKIATENKSINIIGDLLNESGIEFNDSFVTHYAECMNSDKIRTPEQYQLKMLADLRIISKEFNLDSITSKLNTTHIDHLQTDLFNKKTEKKIRYTKQAAKVDAINILTVRKIRGSNNYNYSDIKSFYLTTDRTLNNIMANEDKDKIAETILPSQLYILHNALSYDDDEKKDYQAFNIFLKRRTTEFKYEGSDVLKFIDDIRSFTSDTGTIKEVIKAYSDTKYHSSLESSNNEPEFRSIKQFTATYLDVELSNAQAGDEKYKESLRDAINQIPILLSESKFLIKLFDVFLTIIIVPICITLLKKFTNNTGYIIIGTSLVEGLKFVVSTKTNLYSNWCKKIFKFKIANSHFNVVTKGAEMNFLNATDALSTNEINIWKK